MFEPHARDVTHGSHTMGRWACCSWNKNTKARLLDVIRTLFVTRRVCGVFHKVMCWLMRLVFEVAGRLMVWCNLLQKGRAFRSYSLKPMARNMAFRQRFICYFWVCCGYTDTFCCRLFCCLSLIRSALRFDRLFEAR